MYNKVLLTISTLVLLFVLGACSTNETEQGNGDEQSKDSNTIENLSIQAPHEVSIAAPIYKVIEDNDLGESVEKITYENWNTPDELKARVSSDQVEVSAVPTYVAANLYNRDVDIKLINTLIWGTLHMIGPEGEELDWSDLKGKTIHVPFKGDMPDLVFQYLLNKNDIDKEEIDIEYTSSPQEVVQLLSSGKAEYAILPEHTASLALSKAKKEDKNFQKTMSLQEEWEQATGKEPRIPQGGIIVSEDLIKSNPEVVEELQNQLKRSIQFSNDQPEDAAQLIATHQDGLEPTFIENLIPSLNLEYVKAEEAKDELEFFFNELAFISPDIIGGELPDEEFYYNE